MPEDIDIPHKPRVFSKTRGLCAVMYFMYFCKSRLRFLLQRFVSAERAEKFNEKVQIPVLLVGEIIVKFAARAAAGKRIQIRRGSGPVRPEQAEHVSRPADGAFAISFVARNAGVMQKRVGRVYGSGVRQRIAVNHALAEPVAVPVAHGNFVEVVRRLIAVEPFEHAHVPAAFFHQLFTG